MKEFKRDTFASSFGVLVALAGSAVGLGNMWRFPYIVGENGGAAFIIIYLFFALIFSLPVMLSEFIIGRRSHSNAISAFTKLAPGSKWNLVGVLATATAFVIFSFYIVIGGWSADYLLKALTLQFTDGTDFEQMFNNTVCSVWRPIIFMGIFLLSTAAIVRSGVKEGIEKCSKVMMPVLFFLIVAIAIYSMCLPGAGVGVRYLFKPDFSQVSGKTILDAMGQAFFSLSVGMGILITYASYINKESSLTKMSVLTIVSDTVFAIIASCAIMPVVFAFGGSPSQGPGLVFITLPNLFSKMGIGNIVAILFFASFLLAALTSSIAILEVIIAFLVEKTSLTRSKATNLMAILFFVLGSINSLSQGILADVKIFGMTTLDLFDYVSSNFMMTTCALMTVIFVGWRIGKAEFNDELTGSGTVKTPKIYTDTIFFIIKYIAPIAIAIILLFSFL